MIKYECLTIDFTATGHTEYSGDSEYYIPLDALEAVKEYWDGEGSREEELSDVIENDGYTTDVDLVLGVCATLLELELPTVIEWSSEHIIWLFHDLRHMVYDFGPDGSAHIEQWCEEQAIKYSIDTCAANGIPIPMHIIEKTDKEFQQRFSNHGYFWDYAAKHNTPVEYSNINLGDL